MRLRSMPGEDPHPIQAARRIAALLGPSDCYGRGVRRDPLHRVRGKSTEELLASLMGSEPGSPAHEQAKAAIQVRIAEEQRGAAADGLKWARIAALSTVLATLIALVALIVALFS